MSLPALRFKPFDLESELISEIFDKAQEEEPSENDLDDSDDSEPVQPGYVCYLRKQRPTTSIDKIICIIAIGKMA